MTKQANKSKRRTTNGKTAKADDVRVEVVNLDTLTPDPHNANDHSEYGTHLVHQSISKRGVGRPGFVSRDGVILGGNLSSFEVPGALGMRQAIIVHSRGDMPILHMRDDLDADSDAARMLALEDNVAGIKSYTPNITQLLALSKLDNFHEVIPEGEWKELLAAAELDAVQEELEAKKLNPRNLPLDLIYTFDALNDASCFIAAKAGWKIGIRSAQKGVGRIHGSADKPETWNHAFDLTFIDNDYHNYDHATHLKAVAKFKPKYATVRDVMTKTQCKAAGIPYFPLEQILDWAEELNQHAQNVIVIPKYDCIMDIPAKYVLGYSVPTSHGGTPLSTEFFKGRRVHLLGGSWKAQLMHLAALGDDVVSMDNNYIQKMAQFGSYTLPDGSTGSLTEDLGLPGLVNPLYVALSISLGCIAAKLNELVGEKQSDIRPNTTATSRTSKPKRSTRTSKPNG